MHCKTFQRDKEVQQLEIKEHRRKRQI